MQYTNDEAKILEHFDSQNLTKKGNFIYCKKDASTQEIKLSKFGGEIPQPNTQGAVPKCSDCKKDLEVLVQLYVPTLPENVKSLFPDDLKESLIVVFLCPDDIPCQTQSNLLYKIYNQEQIKTLCYTKSNSNKIDCAVFNEYKEYDTYGDMLNVYLENYKNFPEIDQVKVEELMWKIRASRGSKCYFGGFPYYNQSETNPGDDYQLLINLEDDNHFSMMWGDAGSAQIWVKKNADENRFLLTWQCG